MVNKITVNNQDSNYTHSIFDISEYTGQQYSTLSDALDDIPQAKHKGGMTISYVQTDDNKYVQYRLMSDSWSTTVNDWADVNINIKNTTTSDFSIKDESNNAIVTFKYGHVQTKHFDSSKTPNVVDTVGDLEFQDDNNNVLVRIYGGHIITKHFDSMDIILRIVALENGEQLISRFAGKRLAIIGDSISTFEGTMPPDYAIYYPHGNVNSVDKMWWAIVCRKLGMTYVNTSWSGSRVSGEPKGLTAYAACSDKRVQDVGRLGSPDIIICYISCNDWGADIAVGTWQTNDPIDEDISTQVLELRYAYALMIYKLTKAYPRARIFCCSNLDDTHRDRVSGWPSNNNNGVSTYEWNKNIKEVVEALGAIFIDLHACGINYANIMNFVVDSGLHPNAEGHKLMADYITAQLIANY